MTQQTYTCGELYYNKCKSLSLTFLFYLLLDNCIVKNKITLILKLLKLIINELLIYIDYFNKDKIKLNKIDKKKNIYKKKTLNYFLTFPNKNILIRTRRNYSVTFHFLLQYMLLHLPAGCFRIIRYEFYVTRYFK